MDKYTQLTDLYPPEQLAALNVVRGALLNDPTLLDNRLRPEDAAAATLENANGNS